MIYTVGHISSVTDWSMVQVVNNRPPTTTVIHAINPFNRTALNTHMGLLDDIDIYRGILHYVNVYNHPNDVFVWHPALYQYVTAGNVDVVQVSEFSDQKNVLFIPICHNVHWVLFIVDF